MPPKYREVLERISISKMRLDLVPAPEEDREAFVFLLREGYIEGKERNGCDFIIERVTEAGWRELNPPRDSAPRVVFGGVHINSGRDTNVYGSTVASGESVPKSESTNAKKGLIQGVVVSVVAGLILAYLKGCFSGVLQ